MHKPSTKLNQQINDALNDALKRPGNAAWMRSHSVDRKQFHQWVAAMIDVSFSKTSNERAVGLEVLNQTPHEAAAFWSGKVIAIETFLDVLRNLDARPDSITIRRVVTFFGGCEVGVAAELHARSQISGEWGGQFLYAKETGHPIDGDSAMGHEYDIQPWVSEGNWTPPQDIADLLSAESVPHEFTVFLSYLARHALRGAVDHQYAQANHDILVSGPNFDYGGAPVFRPKTVTEDVVCEALIAHCKKPGSQLSPHATAILATFKMHDKYLARIEAAALSCAVDAHPVTGKLGAATPRQVRSRI